jgi:hypothetical protein
LRTAWKSKPHSPFSQKKSPKRIPELRVDGETLNNPPIELCPAALHGSMPAWLCIEPRSTFLHVLLFSKRTCQCSLFCLNYFLFCCRTAE